MLISLSWTEEIQHAVFRECVAVGHWSMVWVVHPSLNSAVFFLSSQMSRFSLE